MAQFVTETHATLTGPRTLWREYECALGPWLDKDLAVFPNKFKRIGFSQDGNQIEFHNLLRCKFGLIQWPR